MFIGSSIKKIKDTDFLRVKWGSKSNVIKEAVEQFNEQARSRTDEKILSSYPKYLTFFQAESLFQKIQSLTEGKEPIVIEKLELIHQENGKPKSDHEAYATKVKLDDDYICLLEPLMIAVFSNKDKGFEKATYEEKCDYFTESIFQSYINSVEIDPKYLPSLPSKTAVDEALEAKQDVLIEFSHEFPLLEVSESEEISEQQAHQVADLFGGESVKQLESGAGETKQVSETKIDPFDVQPEPETNVQEVVTSSTPEKTAVTVEPVLEKSPVLSDTKDKVSVPVKNIVRQDNKVRAIEPDLEFDFPTFELKNFAKESYAPYETDYVEWRLNELKKEANHYLAKRIQVAVRYSKDAIQNKLVEFERKEYQKIKQEIALKDERASLKERIVKETRASESKELELQESLLDKEYKVALEQEEQRHQAKKREIETDFESRKHAVKHEIQQKFFVQADKRYKEELLAANGNLDRLLQEKLAELDIKKMNKEELLIAQAKQEADKIGQELFDSKRSKLVRLKPLIVEEHNQAKKEHLIKQAKELRQQEREDTLKTNEQLRDQVKELLDSNAKAKEDSYEIQQSLLEEKKRSLQEQTDSLLKFKDALQNESQSKVVVEEQKKKANVWLWPTVVIANLTLLFGGFTLYQQQISQTQRSSLQSTISKQQKSISELKEQQASLKKKEQASQSSAEKVAKEKNKERMNALEKELNDLKAKQAASENTTKAEEAK